MLKTSLIRPATSRRFILGCASALVFLPAKGISQHLTANAPLQTPSTDHDTASLRTQNDANRLTIEVKIDGQGPYHFIVDTGAERSVIADTVAETLALPHGPEITVDSIAGRVMAPTVAIDTLNFGPFVRKDMYLPILPRNKLLVDGYLGLDAINGSRVTFDFKNGALRIEQPRVALNPPAPESETASIRVRGEGGRLRVINCMVDSVSAVAFIDSGAEVSVGNPALRRALAARNKVLVGLSEMTLTGVTGGQVTGEIIPVSRINLQGLAFTNGTLVIADVPDFDNWHTNSRPALLIGMDYLRQFSSVTIDYRFKELRFDLSLAPPKRTPGVKIVTRG